MASPNVYDSPVPIGQAIPMPTQYIERSSEVYGSLLSKAQEAPRNAAQRLRERLQELTSHRELLDAEISRVKAGLMMLDENPAAENIVMTVNSALGREY